MKIEIVNPLDWVERVTPLMADHWHEMGFDFELSPNMEMYRNLVAAGICFAIRAADDTGETIGYCVVMVIPTPHNPRIVMGANDAIFVAPAHRCGLLTGRVIHTAEQEAKRRGANRFTWHCRPGTGFHAMLSRHGYTPLDEIVMKEI